MHRFEIMVFYHLGVFYENCAIQAFDHRDWCVWRNQWFMIVAFTLVRQNYQLAKTKLSLIFTPRKNIAFLGVWINTVRCERKKSALKFTDRPNICVFMYVCMWNMRWPSDNWGALFLSPNMTTGTQRLILEIKGKETVFLV